MKRVICIISVLVLILSLSVNVFAANTTVSVIAAQDNLEEGATTTVTVSLSDTPDASSVLIHITLDNGLSLVSGKWEKQGVINDFTVSNGYGVIALSSAEQINGTVFSFSVKGTEISPEQKIKVDFIFKNSAKNVGTASATKTVNIVCKTHSYSEWSYITAPSCTEVGTEKRYCEVCKLEEIQEVLPTGHTFGEWTLNTPPTCYSQGSGVHNCIVCGEYESDVLDALTHNYVLDYILYDATETEAGLLQEKCEFCGDIIQKSIPPTNSPQLTTSTDISDTESNNSDTENSISDTGNSMPDTESNNSEHKSNTENSIPETTDTANSSDESESDGNGILYIIIAVVAVLLIAAGIAIAIKSKKSSNEKA